MSQPTFSPMGTSTPTPLAPSDQPTHATACEPHTVRASELEPASGTLPAPSFAPPLRQQPIAAPQAGERIGDFELLRELGRGAFATVFLAKQTSLDRVVALKVGANRGAEARTQARLEHENIVQVYFEAVEASRDLRLLCMQYVPGATLQDVLAALPLKACRSGSGRDYVEAVDRASTQPAEFRPAALQEREALAQGSFMEAVCWTGAKLAEALDFAHRHGVLHRDIKPANILVNAYGRPFLADFNLAAHDDGAGAKAAFFGGTLAYMAPEHLDAFNPEEPTPPSAANEQADLYSLGLVLFEMTTGSRPFLDVLDPRLARAEALRRLAAQRRQGAPSAQELNPATPPSLDAVLRRCLAPKPEERFSSVAELATALDQCRRFLVDCRRLPPAPAWTEPLQRHPFLALLALAFFPNLFGSIVNVAYNAIHIVDHLTPTQIRAFNGMVIGYNGLAYPLLVGITACLLRRLHRDWSRTVAGEPLPAAELEAIRRRARFMALWSMLGTSLGWLPGGILFPLAIHFAEPLSLVTWSHFVFSFTISGLIAVTYCYLGSTWLVLRLLYPVLWAQPGASGSLAEELRRRPPLLGLFQASAGIIPLAGAILMLLSGTGDYADFGFRLLVCALIILGMLGFVVALRIGQSLQRIIAVFTKGAG